MRFNGCALAGVFDAIDLENQIVNTIYQMPYKNRYTRSQITQIWRQVYEAYKLGQMRENIQPFNPLKPGALAIIDYVENKTALPRDIIVSMVTLLYRLAKDGKIKTALWDMGYRDELTDTRARQTRQTIKNVLAPAVDTMQELYLPLAIAGGIGLGIYFLTQKPRGV